MLTPLSWLRDFAPLPTEVDELASVFDDLGLVVEGIERVGEGLEAVVVARVLDIEAIAKADRIRKVTVEAGSGPIEVVCGAWNFSVGDLVPLAPVGSVLPGGMSISRRRMKGVESNGMLCSSRELGLGDDASGILVLDGAADGMGEASPPAPGTPLMEVLGIDRDVVFDLAIETNRPDAMCMAGVARDVAARLRLPFSIPEPVVDRSGAPAGDLASLRLESPQLCPRFTAMVLSEVTVIRSPAWLARRLVLAGMRPINSVVDASNYVMLELGQPNHPYDLDRLAGGGLLVRKARSAEPVVTLDGEERITGADGAEDCLICDAAGEPVGIGGIMGGSSSEISDSTRRVLLETAYFTPMAIARTSKRLGLRTEASARFERGIDPEGIERAALRFCELVAATSGPGTVVAPETLDVLGELPGRVRVTLRTARVNDLLGTELGDAEILNILEPLGFEASPVSAGVHEVAIPSFRPDSSREIDVIEEVARLYGYSRIPRTVPLTPQVGRLDGRQRQRRLIRSVVAAAGASEAWTPTLLAPGDDGRAGLSGAPLEVDNPLAREESQLRRSLLPGLLRAVHANVTRRQLEVRLFEIGHVFDWPPPGEQLPVETERLAVVLAGDGDGAGSAVWTWRTLAESLRLTEVRMCAAEPPGLHPTRSARLVAGDLEIGVIGEVDPSVLEAFELGSTRRVGWIEVDLDRLVAAPRRDARSRPVSRYPSSDIDLAFAVDDSVPAADVARTIREAAGEWLETLELFDVFRGPALGAGRRSLAFRLRFCALDHTLTDQEVAGVRTRCIDAVEHAYPAELRS